MAGEAGFKLIRRVRQIKHEGKACFEQKGLGDNIRAGLDKRIGMTIVRLTKLISMRDSAKPQHPPQLNEDGMINEKGLDF